MSNYVYYWRYHAPTVNKHEVILVQGLYPYTEKQVEDFKKSNRVKIMTKECIIHPSDVLFSKMVKSKELLNVDSKFFNHFKHDVMEDFEDEIV